MKQILIAMSVVGLLATTPVLSNGVKWSSGTSKSKMDDSTTAWLDFEANELYTKGFNKGYPQMNIVCRENSTQFYFKMAGAHLTSSEYDKTWGTVRYRIDDKKASSWSMRESTDNTALGLWRGRGIGQIKKLIGAKTLTVAITPYSETTFTMSFNIEGIGEKLKDVRSNCNW